MNSDELKITIENAREAKGISQRELAKLTGISRSTLNDLINGKIKKVDVEDLRKIADTLDISLKKLLKVAGYNDLSSMFGGDLYKNQSTRDLKDKIDEYNKALWDVLDCDAIKRKKALNLIRKNGNIKDYLNEIRTKDNTEAVDSVINDLDEMTKELQEIAKKYDYSKLPKNI